MPGPITASHKDAGEAGPSSPARGSKGKGANAASPATMTGDNQSRHIGAVPDDWPMYSSQPDDYIIGDVIGFGASSVVYQAALQPLGGKACAVKVIDLEAFGRDTEEVSFAPTASESVPEGEPRTLVLMYAHPDYQLRRETQLMSLSKHPNVLRVRGCWVRGSRLYIATRLMSAGSVLDIMRFSYPDGFEEVVIATILKQALEGLNYLHINGWLHRDLKAANMLVDDDGTVLLGDFGVGVFLGDGTNADSVFAGGNGETRKDNPYAAGKRKSFVGTPCWMAPEVVERKHYGTSADIWSFGITALELSQGHAPHSRYPPVKVLMKTLQDEPPVLDRTNGAHKYSKVMEDFVRACLQKDPDKRPTAEKLLHHAFFKQARSKKHLVTAVLSGLPPLAERQEKRRKMSIVSLRNQASWDFGSMSSRGGGGTIHTPLHERLTDPFSNFSGAIASPPGSMREKNHASLMGTGGRRRLMSIDGMHVISTDEADSAVDRLAEKFQSPVSKLEAGENSSSPSRRQRNRSNDSLPAGPAVATGSVGRTRGMHRKSVSFDNFQEGDEDVEKTEEGAAAPALEPISEKRSPLVQAVQDENAAPPPPLALAAGDRVDTDSSNATAVAKETDVEAKKNGQERAAPVSHSDDGQDKERGGLDEKKKESRIGRLFKNAKGK